MMPPPASADEGSPDPSGDTGCDCSNPIVDLTTALLGHWQEDREGCVPDEVESCGVEPT